MHIIKKLAPWKGLERNKTIEEIVIHGTGGTGTLQFVLNGGRASEYERGIGLFHYLIGLNGSVYQLVEDTKWCYHSTSGKHDETTLGIEIEKYDWNNQDEPTKEQYIALNLLVDHLCKRYPVNKIVGHNYNAKLYSHRTAKPCPGRVDPVKLHFNVSL